MFWYNISLHDNSSKVRLLLIILYRLQNFLKTFQLCLIFSAQIAHKLVDDSCFGLIFGINTFVALIMQSILTAIVINGLKLGIRDQYKAYMIYYAILCFSGSLLLFVKYIIKRHKK